MSDDYISRQEAIYVFKEAIGDKYPFICEPILTTLSLIPSVTSKQKTEFIPKSVVEDIKADLISDYNNNADNWNYCAGIHRAIELIDNRISGKDKE